jgi:hypothetical protein
MNPRPATDSTFDTCLRDTYVQADPWDFLLMVRLRSSDETWSGDQAPDWLLG